MHRQARQAIFFACATALVPVASVVAAVPTYDHVVVVEEENHSYTQITSTYASSAPYINQTLIAQGASFTKFFGEEHESEGNYLWQFAGSNFDIGFDDPVPVGPFNAPNLGADLISAGYSFKGYSEDLPSIGYTGSTSGAYARKHNPWVNFSNVPNGTTVATSSNLRLTDFPTDFTQLPTVSYVIPNQNDDMHNGSNPSTVATGDAWLQTHLDSYYQWAETHNSLLIVTFDEDNGSGTLTNPGAGQNKIMTVVVGAGIAQGSFAEGVGANHVNLLRTIEDVYSLPHAGAQTSVATGAGFTNSSLSDFFVQWKNDGDGLWSDGSQWVGGIAPSGNGAVANLLSAINSPRTITLSAARTINVLNIDNSAAYTIAGAGTLNFDAVAGASAKVRVASGSHLVSAAVTATADLTMEISANASLTLSNIDTTGINITKTGGGYVEQDKLRGNTVSINAGTIAITANGSASAVSRVTNLNIAGGATPTAALDLADNDLIVTGSSYAAVTSAIAFARDGNTWDRPGITSSSARAAPSRDRALGTIAGTEFHHLFGNDATFDQFAVANSDVLVRYTYNGDSDLNGKVDGNDYAHIDATFNNEPTAGNIAGWVNGDFDYSGKVDGADYALIDSAFNSQSGTLARALAYLNGSDTDRADMNVPALSLVVEHFDQFGTIYQTALLNSVPEPSSLLAFFSLTSISILRKRRARD